MMSPIAVPPQDQPQRRMGPGHTAAEAVSLATSMSRTAAATRSGYAAHKTSALAAAVRPQASGQVPFHF